jgi:hypothetical protein
MIPRTDMEALQVDYDKVHGDLQALETVAIKLCQEIERVVCQSSGSSIANRLSSLGYRVIERLRGALRLRVQKTVRHGYSWVPTDQAHDRPRQVGPAY